MVDFKCDSCQKTVSEKDKYKLRCSGECRRYFCMSCTGLDKVTTKMLYQQKHHNIRFFCSVCDSPTLKYLHEKVTQLQKSQIPLESVEAFGTCLKKNNDLLPVITEIYDILNNHDSKWRILHKKIDDIHSLHSRISDNGQESLVRSIRDMKQDIFNLSSIFMDNHDESVKVHVHDSSREELIKEMGDLRKSVNQMALTVEKLAAKDKPNIRSSPPTVKKAISTQTDYAENHDTIEINCPNKIARKPSIKEDWHYVLVSRIPPPYTEKQLAHYVKEKLGTTDFIRCFPMLKSEVSSDSDFKVGVQNKNHLKLLKDTSMWPPGTVIDGQKENPPKHAISLLTSLKLSPPASNTPTTIPSTTSREVKFVLSDSNKKASAPSANSASMPLKVSPQASNTYTTAPGTISGEVKSVQIGSDKEAIAASKSLARENLSFMVTKKNAKNDDGLCMDPMTPPIVRLSKTSDADNSRYLLARLRDPSILKTLRLFLAYLHDQPSSECFEGHTNTSIKLMLASEGLPSDVDSLRKLYYRFHNAYGIGLPEVEADLSAFRSFFSSEKLLRLQKIRECHNNYFSSGSPTRNKNF